MKPAFFVALATLLTACASDDETCNPSQCLQGVSLKMSTPIAAFGSYSFIMGNGYRCDVPLPLPDGGTVKSCGDFASVFYNGDSISEIQFYKGGGAVTLRIEKDRMSVAEQTFEPDYKGSDNRCGKCLYAEVEMAVPAALVKELDGTGGSAGGGAGATHVR